MEFIADLHIHSHFSRATGKQLNLENLDLWGGYKGITVLGTGDCTHPGWLAEIGEKLAPAEAGLYVLKPEFRLSRRGGVPAGAEPPATRFLVTGEISSIYKKNGQTRKVHTLVLLPSLEAGRELSRRLGQLGNVISDGRPILGLDAKHVLEVILEIDADSLVIPAHIWTPWFSVLGSKSGFDSLEECYEDMLDHIHALETGLSSDPPMNWRLSSLDRFALVSNSDAHSPQKIGREANIFDTGLSYPAIAAALKTKEGFLGTLEFFPDEGKYHLDGHRRCGQRLEPAESKNYRGLCPVCRKPLTLGVLHRVLDLGDRPPASEPPGARPYQHLVPLPEIISEVVQCGPESKKVTELYFRLLQNLGPELNILRHMPLTEIARQGGALLAAGIDRMRREQVHIEGGYDGEYGVVRLFRPEEMAELSRQAKFWEFPPEIMLPALIAAPSTNIAPRPVAVTEPEAPSPLKGESPAVTDPWLQGLNPAQAEAVTYDGGPLLVQAGPGTGKTRTLTQRVGYLVQSRGLSPDRILAVTFTRQAAGEMRERLQQHLGDGLTGRLAILTFHALGMRILQAQGIAWRRILSEDERRPLLQETARQCGLPAKTLDRGISRQKQECLYPEDLAGDVPWLPAYQAYEAALEAEQAWDFDDLVARAVKLLRQQPEVLAACQQRFAAILVDEYQDLNQAQYELLRLLAPGDRPDLFVIGDANQAIYGFRGAQVKYFVRFSQDWPLARTIHLAETYRLPPPVLQLARSLIPERSGNSGVPEILHNTSEMPPILLKAANPEAEAAQLAQVIDHLVGGTSHLALEDERLRYANVAEAASYRDIAVLYRFHALGQVVQKHFQAAGIPCQLAREAAGPEITGIDLKAEKVTLLTLHAAKGLEFPYVFLIGCEAGLLPYEPGEEGEGDPVEEQRLIYVGLTRASRQVFLSYARRRVLWGSPGSGRPAAWVQALRNYLLDYPYKNTQAAKKRARQRNLF